MIPVFKPTLGQDELLSVADSFNSGWIGKGRKVDEFEHAWAQHIGVKSEQAVSVNSCTEGIFQAVWLLGIGSGDEVIVPTIHFVGAAQAVLDADASPVFCDVNPRTLNATAEHIQARITNKTKAVVLNHYGGVPCEMSDIMTLLQNHPGIMLIEDAACAPASRLNGQAIGTFGDIGIWSFDGMKVLSTGDGGMMYIRDEALARKARKQLYLGISTVSGLSSKAERWWEFDVEILGARRSVMNDIAAGIGLEQLKKIDSFIQRRWEIVARYESALKDYVTVPYNPGYYFYWIQHSRRNELAHYLKARGVYVTFRYDPLHRAYDTDDYLPGAEKAADTTLLLPLHQGLSDEDVSLVCERVREFFE